MERILISVEALSSFYGAIEEYLRIDYGKMRSYLLFALILRLRVSSKVSGRRRVEGFERETDGHCNSIVRWPLWA